MYAYNAKMTLPSSPFWRKLPNRAEKNAALFWSSVMHGILRISLCDVFFSYLFAASGLRAAAEMSGSIGSAIRTTEAYYLDDQLT